MPLNYALLFGFTLCQSWVVSCVCSVVMLSNKNGGTLVLMAALLTLAITLGLTYYACTCKTDFTMMGGSLFVFCIALFVFGLFTMIFQNKLLHIIYVTLGAVLFGLYILYDTQLIVGNKSQKYDIDDYIIAALMIYVDIISLFIELLSLLTDLFGDN